jgi:Skp family chaperone for outer membrane proteins
MNKSMRTFLIMLVVGLAASGSFAVQAQELRIGVFDPQRVSEETNLGRQLQNELGAFQAMKQKEIDDKRVQVEQMQGQLRTQELSLSSATRNKMEKDIQRRVLFLEAAQETATREMQLELAAAKMLFEEKLLISVQEFGKSEEFSLILDRSLVAWADKTVDITGALIDVFNRMFPADTGGS